MTTRPEFASGARMSRLLLAQTEVLGIRLLGFDAATGRKVVLTVTLFVVVALVSAVLGRALERLHAHPRLSFWGRQTLRVITAVVVLSGIVSVWFDDPSRLTTVIGLVTAGVAIALQRVITAMAAYVIILRGKQFQVGDRITIGGVRGDVVALDFIQTTVMEMGQAPGEQGDDPSIWVSGRQYTGRLVRVTNDRIFETPLYNYTREFPFIWDEISVPIKYDADRKRAEAILLEVAQSHTEEVQRQAATAIEALKRRYRVPGTTGLAPRVYMKLTDNWIELALRFITPAHDVRELKSAMSREILDRFDAARIQVASATFEVVGVPRLDVKLMNSGAVDR